MKMKAYEVLGEALVTEGVDTVFGLMTSDNMSLLTNLAERGVTVIRARTEHGAVCMADGYARATGRVGVASIGAGPSAAMAGTALLTARRKRTPLVVICGDVPTTDRHHLKWFEQAAYFETTAGHCLSLASTRTIVEDAFQVFRHARSGAGPSVLNCPVNLLEAEVNIEEFMVSDWRFMAPWSSPAVPLARQSSIAEAATMIAESQRILFIAGRGATDAGAAAAIQKCASRVGGLLGTSLQAQGLFDDAYYIGVVGGLGTDLAGDLVDEADCVVAVGAGLNVYTAGFGLLFPKARIIQIDDKPAAFGQMTPVDLAVLGDARDAIEAIDSALDVMGINERSGFRDELTRERIVSSFDFRQGATSTKPGLLDTREAAGILDEKLPADRIAVVDAGHFMYFIVDQIHTRRPNDRIWTADFASIGVAVSIGIGVAAARPEQPTVAFIGDGGFMMSLLELDSAVRHRIPLTVVVLNDEAYGAEVRYLENRGVDASLARFDSPDLEAVVKGLGCDAVTVRTVEELEAACERVGKTPGPFVIDVRIDIDVRHRHLASRTGSAASPS